ncbi:hypothetical protein [Arcticibacter sp.]|jgi:hypothetical protein|uniref:hypothetical protein n=1 Tax=Arcticibacter sp. TaxID=1872630 RepID=UPI00388F3087
MYRPFKILTSLFCLVLLFSACKKDERTADEWGQLAEAKLKEIKKLGEAIPCDKQANVTLQDVPMGCDAQYFPVLSSDIEEFNRLKSDYQKYSAAQAEAWAKEGRVADTAPCWMVSWMTEQPLRLECKDSKVKLITTEDISIAEAKSLAEITHKQVTDYLNMQKCTSSANWAYTALIKDKTMGIQFIPYSVSSDSKEFKQKVSLYNRLMLRIIDAEGSRDLTSDVPRVEGVDCVNGKPVLRMIE